MSLDIVDWIQDKGTRYWTCVPGWPASGLDFELLKQHARLWHEEAYERYPTWLQGGRPVVPRRDGRHRRVERSGHLSDSLAAGPATAGPHDSAAWGEFSDAGQRSRRVFKCIRRYVLRHVLGGRIGLLSRLDRLERLGEWPRLLREDVYTRMGLAFLLWSQSSYWGESEWDWLRRTVGCVERLAPRRWSRPPSTQDPVSSRAPGSCPSAWCKSTARTELRCAVLSGSRRTAESAQYRFYVHSIVKPPSRSVVQLHSMSTSSAMCGVDRGPGLEVGYDKRSSQCSDELLSVRVAKTPHRMLHAREAH